MGRVDGSEPKMCSTCGENSEEFYYPLHHSRMCRKELAEIVADRDRYRKALEAITQSESPRGMYDIAIEELQRKV